MKILKEQGFTIIELMLVLLIIAVSIMLATPNFSNIIRKNNLIAATNELTGILQYAKVLAAATNMPTIVCPLMSSSASSSNEMKCVDSKEAFNKATKIGVFRYNSNANSANLELSRVMNLPSSVTLKDTKDKAQSIAFYPDNSAGIHGINIEKGMDYFQKDGSIANSSLNLSSLKFPDPTTTNSANWQIQSTVAADNKCYLVSVSRLGKAVVNEDNCQ